MLILFHIFKNYLSNKKHSLKKKKCRKINFRENTVKSIAEASLRLISGLGALIKHHHFWTSLYFILFHFFHTQNEKTLLKNALCIKSSFKTKKNGIERFTERICLQIKNRTLPRLNSVNNFLRPESFGYKLSSCTRDDRRTLWSDILYTSNLRPVRSWL